MKNYYRSNDIEKSPNPVLGLIITGSTHLMSLLIFTRPTDYYLTPLSLSVIDVADQEHTQELNK
jgi:hypothetical protein